MAKVDGPKFLPFSLFVSVSYHMSYSSKDFQATKMRTMEFLTYETGSEHFPDQRSQLSYGYHGSNHGTAPCSLDISMSEKLAKLENGMCSLHIRILLWIV